MPADIAKCGRTEERIRKRMENDIGIRMPVEAPRVRYFHAPEDELPAFDEAVHIKTKTDPG